MRLCLKFETTRLGNSVSNHDFNPLRSGDFDLHVLHRSDVCSGSVRTQLRYPNLEEMFECEAPEESSLDVEPSVAVVWDLTVLEH